MNNDEFDYCVLSPLFLSFFFSSLSRVACELRFVLTRFLKTF